MSPLPSRTVSSVCEGVRSFFDYVIVLPRDLKNNKEDIPDKLNDHTADCVRSNLPILLD